MDMMMMMMMMWFKQIQPLFYCCWGSKVAELISLKFTVQFDHCPRFMLSFHSTVLSFFVTGFLQGFKLCAQRMEVVEMDEILKFNFDLNRCLGTCQKALQFENSHFSFKMKNLVCFWNFLGNAIFFNIDKNCMFCIL